MANVTCSITEELFGGNKCNLDNNFNDYSDDNNRATDSRSITFSRTERNEEDNDKNFDTKNNTNINIFRYKFGDDFTCELFKFSKIHQYDHRKDFKEAWKKWLEENECIVDEESTRLKDLGYNGDILEKMFKSARYYFRKKSTEKKAPIERREYMGVQKILLEAMDNHIKMNANKENFKPSEGFDDFCNTNKDLLREEVNSLCKNGMKDPVEIKNKIKKTYKNRYFIFITK